MLKAISNFLKINLILKNIKLYKVKIKFLIKTYRVSKQR